MEVLLCARKDVERAASKQIQISQEIGKARHLINNLEYFEQQAAYIYELKCKIANECLERLKEAKAELDRYIMTISV